jgi:hypothetical protein
MALRSTSCEPSVGCLGRRAPQPIRRTSCETFERDAKVDMVQIAFEGAAPLEQEVLSPALECEGWNGLFVPVIKEMKLD